MTGHHCAKRKKTSIICVANLHSLPWNITSKAHKIRTMRVKPGLLEKKRSSGSSGGSSNPVSIHPRTKSNYKKAKTFERTEFGLQFLDDRRGEDII